MEFIDEYLPRTITTHTHPHNGYYSGFAAGQPATQEEVR